MSYKQTSYLSPSERQIINTLMPGNFEGTMREIIAKLNEASYITKLFNTNSTAYVGYVSATAVGIVGTPWTYDTLAFWRSSDAVDAGVSIDEAPLSEEPKAMLNGVAVVTPVAITTSGAGGLDTGVEAISTWYYVYEIGKSTDATAVNGLLSVEPITSDITMPSGYDLATRVGMVFNNASGNFEPFQERKNGTQREYWFLSAVQILVDGAATSWTQVTGVMPLPEVYVLGTYLRFSLDAAFRGVVGSATGFEFFNLDYALDSFHFNNEYLPNIRAEREIWYNIASGGGETIDIYMNGFAYDAFPLPA